MSLVFAHPGIAALTLGLMALPVIIHLLTRRRFRQEPWAAMTFLLAAQRRSRRRIRLEQWLLLVIRTLLVAALGWAIARPALSSSALARTIGEARFDRLLIIDNTLSMQARRPDGTTAFEAARQLAARLVDSFDAHDGVAIVTLARPFRAVIDRPTIDRPLVHRAIDGLAGSAAAADLAGALATAKEVLAAGDAPSACKAVYILTDAGRNTWQRERGAPPGSGDAVGAAFAALAAPERRFIINTGALERGNVAITDLRPLSRWTKAGSAVTVELEAHGYGAAPAANAEIEILLDGTPVQRVAMGNMRADSSKRFECVVRPGSAGSHVVTARMSGGGDVLAADDERSCAVELAQNIPVLVVSSGGELASTRDPAFYLMAALSPGAAGSDALFAPRLIDYGDMTNAPFDGVRTIILTNVPGLPASQWSRLEEFVRAGGGLIVSGGDRVDPASYNAQRLLPVEFGQVVSVGESASAIRLRVDDWTHAGVAELSGHLGGGLLTTPIRQYLRMSPAGREGADKSRTILSLENGDAALVERSVGRGRVLVWTGSMQMDWSTLPAKPDFVPLVMNLVAFASGQDSAARNVGVGEPLVDAIRADAASHRWTIRRPDGSEDTATVTRSADKNRGPWALRYERTDQPGRYAAEDGHERRWYAVTTDRAESDLAAMSEYELRQRLGAPFGYLDSAEELINRRTVSPRHEISNALIGALFVLALAESLLAAWFGHQR